MRAEIDKGVCGDCRYFDPRKPIKTGMEEVWEGTCSNYKAPFTNTRSNYSPREAFINAGVPEKLKQFLKEDTTCLTEYSQIKST